MKSDETYSDTQIRQALAADCLNRNVVLKNLAREIARAWGLPAHSCPPHWTPEFAARFDAEYARKPAYQPMDDWIAEVARRWPRP